MKVWKKKDQNKKQEKLFERLFKIIKVSPKASLKDSKTK